MSVATTPSSCLFISFIIGILFFHIHASFPLNNNDNHHDRMLTTTTRHKLPIVYVFSVVPNICKHGLPNYIKYTLEQSVVSQPDAETVIVSNFGDCANIESSMSDVKDVTRIDSTKISSNRTKEFERLCVHLFQQDGGGELWMTSAIRFFIMEDYMISHGINEILHVEADNLLFGNMTGLLPTLRKGYPGLAATPLNSDKSFVTASVFWVANLESLHSFTEMLMNLATRETGEYDRYLAWLRPFACCKHGGIAPDAEGKGIKPFAVNEMSMLAYYHHIRPKEFFLFPVVPKYEYAYNRHTINMARFAPGGSDVGPETDAGIWDPNSWGQFLGGTHDRRGRNRGFIDRSHIAGQAILINRGYDGLNFNASMRCSDMSYSSTFDRSRLNAETLKINTAFDPSTHHCVTAPFVRFGQTPESQWVPIWNLHVQSKHTALWVSAPCVCGESDHSHD